MVVWKSKSPRDVRHTSIWLGGFLLLCSRRRTSPASLDALFTYFVCIQLREWRADMEPLVFSSTDTLHVPSLPHPLCRKPTKKTGVSAGRSFGHVPLKPPAAGSRERGDARPAPGPPHDPPFDKLLRERKGARPVGPKFGSRSRRGCRGRRNAKGQRGVCSRSPV